MAVMKPTTFPEPAPTANTTMSLFLNNFRRVAGVGGFGQPTKKPVKLSAVTPRSEAW